MVYVVILAFRFRIHLLTKITIQSKLERVSRLHRLRQADVAVATEIICAAARGVSRTVDTVGHHGIGGRDIPPLTVIAVLVIVKV